MLRRFSIALKEGVEVFVYEPRKSGDPISNPQLLAAFIENMHSSSEATDSFQQIRFSNRMYYAKQHELFTLLFVFDEKKEKVELEELFERLVKAIQYLLVEEKITGRPLPSKEMFHKALIPILTPFTQDSFDETIQELTISRRSTKIGLVGLGNAGKTSIKNKLFENWSREMLQDITATIDVETSQQFQDFLDQNFVILDFGGQVAYRKQHLLRDDLWIGISALVFVVDIQDTANYKTARDFLSAVWEIILKVNEQPPKLTIFFHKYDLSLREELTQNVRQCLILFKEYIGISTFYLTTLDDTSSNVALIKSLYFSLPEIMLKRLLEEELLIHIDKELLPVFFQVVRNKDYLEVFPQLKQKIRQNAIVIGTTYGASLQQAWLQSLAGIWTPQQHISSSKVRVFQQGQSLFITIKDWSAQGFPKEFTNTLLDGILEGLLKTFHLETPEIVDDIDNSTTWKIYL